MFRRPPPRLLPAIKSARSALTLTTARLLCPDFEASGTDPHGYPIEVAVADVATGTTIQWLIAPTPAWLESGTWDTAAEAVHGLSRGK